MHATANQRGSHPQDLALAVLNARRVRPHRALMNRTWGDEHETIEDRFRNPEDKKEFSVYQNAITSFYEACKPDILTGELLPESLHRGKYKRTEEAFEYLRKIISRKRDDEGNFAEARDKADALIDESIVSAGYTIDSLKEIDLSRIDFDKLEQRFKAAPYKNLSITDMVDFLKERARRLLERNVTRMDLAAKLQEIINNYNTVTSDVEAFFRALREYAERLRDEEKEDQEGAVGTAGPPATAQARPSHSPRAGIFSIDIRAAWD